MERLDEQEVMAIYSRKSNEWTLLTAGPQAKLRMAELAPEQSQAWRELGVSMLHSLVIEDALGLVNLPKPTYVHLVDEVNDGLKGRLEGNLTYNLAALVMPASLEHIQEISLRQERMPAKSTYFYPKLVSGLVIHPLS